MNDMPPGVSPSSIPGNSPEDEKFEAAIEELTNYEPELAVRVMRAVMPLVSDIEAEAYREGYKHGFEVANRDAEERSEQMAFTMQGAKEILLALSNRNDRSDELAEPAWYWVKRIDKVLEP